MPHEMCIATTASMFARENLRACGCSFSIHMAARAQRQRSMPQPMARARAKQVQARSLAQGKREEQSSARIEALFMRGGCDRAHTGGKFWRVLASSSSSRTSCSHISRSSRSSIACDARIQLVFRPRAGSCFLNHIYACNITYIYHALGVDLCVCLLPELYDRIFIGWARRWHERVVCVII